MHSYPELYSVSEVETMVQELADRVNQECQGEWLVICVLTGGVIFTADLVRKLTFPIELESLKVTRYHNTTKGDQLDWHLTPKSPLAGKRVLLVDDIFDEGQTLAALFEFCQNEGAVEVKSAVLLDKQHDRRAVDYKPDFVGIKCPDKYVFGYGMDMEGQYRHLPAIHVLPKR